MKETGSSFFEPCFRLFKNRPVGGESNGAPGLLKGQKQRFGNFLRLGPRLPAHERRHEINRFLAHARRGNVPHGFAEAFKEKGLQPRLLEKLACGRSPLGLAPLRVPFGETRVAVHRAHEQKAPDAVFLAKKHRAAAFFAQAAQPRVFRDAQRGERRAQLRFEEPFFAGRGDKSGFFRPVAENAEHRAVKHPAGPRADRECGSLSVFPGNKPAARLPACPRKRDANPPAEQSAVPRFFERRRDKPGFSPGVCSGVERIFARQPPPERLIFLRAPPVFPEGVAEKEKAFPFCSAETHDINIARHGFRPRVPAEKGDPSLPVVFRAARKARFFKSRRKRQNLPQGTDAHRNIENRHSANARYRRTAHRLVRGGRRSEDGPQFFDCFFRLGGPPAVVFRERNGSSFHSEHRTPSFPVQRNTNRRFAQTFRVPVANRARKIYNDTNDIKIFRLLRPKAAKQHNAFSGGIGMPQRSFVTTVPDRSGAFLRASEIIARHGGNISRASYNRAVDTHTIFLDVEAPAPALDDIARELAEIGYLGELRKDSRVVVVTARIPDRPGALLPALRILSRSGINISYLNSTSDDRTWQDFRMGLLIEDPSVVKKLLDEIGALFPIDIVDYGGAGANLDNTIFYIRLAAEMRALLGLGENETKQFLAESNRVLQSHEARGETPVKVFDYIRRFAGFIRAHRGENFTADVQRVPLGEGAFLYNVQPPCGSNTYVLASEGTLTLVDTGYAIYSDELLAVLRRLFPDWDASPKQAVITHADVDHCGALRSLGLPVLLNRKSASSLRRQLDGEPDSREGAGSVSLGYSKLSQIISGYRPPDPASFVLLDRETPAEHDNLLPIGRFEAGGLRFEALEGSGGHLPGEMVFVNRQQGVLFTGDILVNISGFSPERAEFNSLAPYLMRSVNVDSKKANEMRRAVTELALSLGEKNGRPCLVCGGHGPISSFQNGRLESLPQNETIRLGQAG